jgi:hypothetical protein
MEDKEKPDAPPDGGQEARRPDSAEGTTEQEARYQKRSSTEDQEKLQEEAEKRYTTRLKPARYKPGSYLWGYKDWPGEDTDKEADPEDEGGHETGRQLRDTGAPLDRNWGVGRREEPTADAGGTSDPEE